MRTRTLLIFVLSLILVIAVGALVFADTQILQRPWYVIGSGGGMAQSAGYQMNHTIGQPFAGSASSSSRQISSGYWPGIAGVAPEAPQQNLFLPAIFGPGSAVAAR